MRLRALLETDALGLRLLGGAGELDRGVRGVMTTDLRDPSRYLSGGELVLTGLAWRRSAEDAEPFVRILNAAGVAGLAAGEAELGHIPEDLVTACVRHRMPLFAVREDVAFATITEHVVRQVSGERAGDLAAVVDRHRRLMTSGPAGGGPEVVLDLLTSDLDLRAWVLTPTGRLIAGGGERLPAGRAAELAAEHLAATRSGRRSPHRVTVGGTAYSLFPIHDGVHAPYDDRDQGPIREPERSTAPAAFRDVRDARDVRETVLSDWFLAVEADAGEWPAARLDLLRGVTQLISVERDRRDASRTVRRRLAQEVVDLVQEGAPPADIAARLRVAAPVLLPGVGAAPHWQVVVARLEWSGDDAGTAIASGPAGQAALEEILAAHTPPGTDLSDRIAVAHSDGEAIALVPIAMEVRGDEPGAGAAGPRRGAGVGAAPHSPAGAGAHSPAGAGAAPHAPAGAGVTPDSRAGAGAASQTAHGLVSGAGTGAGPAPDTGAGLQPGNDNPLHPGSGSGARTGTGSAASTGTGTDAGAGARPAPGSGNRLHPGSGSGARTDTGPAASTETGTGIAAGASAAPAKGTPSHPASGSGARTGTGPAATTGTGTDAVAGAAPGNGNGTLLHPGSGSGARASTGPGTHAGAGTGNGTPLHPASGSGARTGTGPVASTGTGTDASAGAGTGTPLHPGSGNGARTGTGSAAGTGSGPRTGAAPAVTGSGARTGATAAVTGTDAGTGIRTGAPTEPPGQGLHADVLLGAVRGTLSAGLGEDGRLTFGVSAAVHSAEGLRGALEEARHARRVAAARPGRVCAAGHHELASHVLLLPFVPDDVRRAFTARLLDPLREYDKRHRAELIPTLEAFLDCDGSWTRCAARLHLHVNTLRYRVGRIEQLTGRDLARLEDKLDFFLALRMG
ncbi:PucR family transcriptional regulator ligand-binding domain-containing protein [Streptomyces sp. NPDC006638]|uniref:PucR family transcriptional regulator ligand-binding domain-containing protein n=1 Tax=Streptomyces sp. NPDC006638 TaxID=3157183 RepID=UPI0033BB4D35